jgi:predicted nucleic acid-binding protein
MNMRRETLICDSSFVSHLAVRKIQPKRYDHWDKAVMNRVEGARLAVSVVTLAEARGGYIDGGWSSRRVADAERMLAKFLPILIDDPHVNEWARLWAAARANGIAISHNDLWIAATASVRGQVLITCDRDHVRIAPELPGEVLFLAPPV